MAKHHLPDDLLVEYATATADPAHGLVAACHASLCPRCQVAADECITIGGALLSTLPEAEASRPSDADVENIIARTMAAARGDIGLADPRRSPDPTSDLLPAPLRREIGSLNELAWRRPFPGLRVFEFRMPHSSASLRLTETRPGMGVARHGHAGQELAIVLAGGLHDRTLDCEFERGDVQVAGPGLEHELQTLPGEPCVVLTVRDGPVLPRGLLAQAVYRWLGWTRR